MPHDISVLWNGESETAAVIFIKNIFFVGRKKYDQLTLP